jgi:hypothetical protein
MKEDVPLVCVGLEVYCFTANHWTLIIHSFIFHYIILASHVYVGEIPLLHSCMPQKLTNRMKWQSDWSCHFSAFSLHPVLLDKLVDWLYENLSKTLNIGFCLTLYKCPISYVPGFTVSAHSKFRPLIRRSVSACGLCRTFQSRADICYVAHLHSRHLCIITYFTHLLQVMYNQPYYMFHPSITYFIHLLLTSSIFYIFHPSTTCFIHLSHVSSIYNMFHPSITCFIHLLHISSIYYMFHPSITCFIHL